MKKALAVLMITTSVFALTMPIAAANYTFYETSVDQYQSWTYVSQDDDIINVDPLNYIETTYFHYKGTDYNFTPIKAVSANYYHWKGSADLNASQVIQDTYTVKTTADFGNEAAAFGTQVGFAYSHSSALSVQSTISPGLPSGYYFFGVKFRIRDFKTRENKQRWRFNLWSWSWERVSSSNLYYYATKVDYTGSGSPPTYYGWYMA
ncbi:MAG: hypothetical protein ACOX1A_08255 [Saccharofermentanales bacterium]